MLGGGVQDYIAFWILFSINIIYLITFCNKTFDFPSVLHFINVSLLLGFTVEVYMRKIIHSTPNRRHQFHWNDEWPQHTQSSLMNKGQADMNLAELRHRQQGTVFPETEQAPHSARNPSKAHLITSNTRKMSGKIKCNRALPLPLPAS